MPVFAERLRPSCFPGGAASALLQMSMTGAFTFSKSNVQFDYKVDGSSVSLATVTGVAVAATEIALLNPTTTTLVFRESGVNFNFSLTAASAKIGDYFEFSGAALTANNLNFDYGTKQFSGSLAFTFGSFKLFPSAPIFTVSTTGSIDARYNITGAAPSGVLSISIPDFSLNIAGAIELEASHIVITPLENVLADERVSVPPPAGSAELRYT